MITSLSDHIAEIELATNAHDMREPIAQALESLSDELNGFDIDEIPTKNSTNLVESQGVYQLWSDLVEAETFLLPTDQIILGEKNITEPGSYDASNDGFDGYSHVEVNEAVGRLTANLKPKYIYQTGVYNPADDNCDGYSEVHVELDKSSLMSVVNRTINHIDPENSIDRVGPYAFYSCNHLQNVILPMCTAIEAHAFEGCTLLTSVSASACTELSQHAFANCPNLRNVILQDLTYVPEGAFASCASLSCCVLASVSILYNDYRSMVCLHHVSSYAFANCYNFQGFGFIPNGASTPWPRPALITDCIDDYAFYNCSLYSDIVQIYPLGSSGLLTDITIGKCAFENCINLPGISIGLSYFWPLESSSLTCKSISTIIIKESAFKNCFNLSRFSILEHWGNTNHANYSVEKIIIGSNAFENCSHFTGANDASSVYWNNIEIHEAAFRNANLLPIPLRNVNYIGKYAFQNLLVPDEDYIVWDDSYYLGNGSHLLTIYSPSESVTLVDNYAFENAAIKIADLHGCHLNSMAFANCQSLSLLNLYGNCSFANYTFDQCLSLSTIYIDSPSVVISEHTFANTYLDLYSTFSDINNKKFEPQILIRSIYFSIYMNDSVWSRYSSYMKDGTP